MGSISISRVRGSHLWRIDADYSSQKLKDACRSVPGMVWVSPTGSEDYGHGEGFVDAIDHLIGYLGAKGIRVRNRSDLPETPSSTHHLLVASKGLRDYQKVGVDFCIANAPEGCILADDMGLGKTFQALVVSHAFKTKTVVVCLSYAKSTWSREIEKRFPKTKFQILEGVKDARAIDPQTELIVVNYDILYAWLPWLVQWKARGLIIDEMHLISNLRSRRTLSVLGIRKVSSWCLGLSGTPMTNRPASLYGALSVICPGRFGDEPFAYQRVFCDGHYEEIEVRME